MTGKSFLHSTRSNGVDLDTLLNRMDGDATPAPPPRAKGAGNRRKHQRAEFRKSDVAFRVEHPGGGESRFLVCTRNLSAGGLSILHGGFLHKGSRCKVTLLTLAGKVRTIAGFVASCRLVAGRIHEIGIRFEEKIDPNNFVAQRLESEKLEDKLSRPVKPPPLNFSEIAAEASQNLLAAINPPNLVSAKAICLQLKRIAAQEGYESVSEEAAATLQALNHLTSVAKCVPQLQRLSLMCQRVSLRYQHPVPDPAAARASGPAASTP